MSKGIDLDIFSHSLRERAIKKESKQILVTNFLDSEQAKDASNINCEGFGRIRTLSQTPRPNWVNSCVRYRVASARMGLSDTESELCQVFQNAVCNFRCWFCFVDYKLLKGDFTHSAYLTVDDLLELFLREKSPARIIALSGGQPDIIPEWAPWFIKALLHRGLTNEYFIWLDDNLSTQFAWGYLTGEEWELMKWYPNFGRLCGIKSFTKERFFENTNVRPEFFDRQLDTLGRLVKEGMDVYIELALTTSDLSNLAKDMSDFFDLLQQKVHHNIPLRINPTQIREYSPNKNRILEIRRLALVNQYVVLNAFLEELHKRFSSSELALPQHLVQLN